MTNQFPAFKRLSVALVGAGAIALSFWSAPTLAKDPFRASNPRNIGDKTEAAFKAIFEEGNYTTAKTLLQQAQISEANEPLVYAMQASIAYGEGGKDGNAIKDYARKTRETAQGLSDPLRNKLYTAVGIALEVAYGFKFENKSPLEAVTQLQKVFEYLDDAKKIAPNDPDLNLVKGYMDLMLASNLPFSDPTQGIEQLEQASPKYLAERGIAIGYRDLKQYNQALKYANLALSKTPDNPEAHYLKAQILYKLSNFREAEESFKAASKYINQLPKLTKRQLFLEQCQNENSLNKTTRNCRQERDTNYPE